MALFLPPQIQRCRQTPSFWPPRPLRQTKSSQQMTTSSSLSSSSIEERVFGLVVVVLINHRNPSPQLVIVSGRAWGL